MSWGQNEVQPKNVRIKYKSKSLNDERRASEEEKWN